MLEKDQFYLMERSLRELKHALFKQVKSGSVALCPFAITPIANIFNTPRNPIE